MSPRAPAERASRTAVRRRPPHEDQIEFGPQAGKRVGDRRAVKFAMAGLSTRFADVFGRFVETRRLETQRVEVRGQFAAPAADVEDRLRQRRSCALLNTCERTLPGILV